jgi:pimeloyl-ACP methyl ester carboxylesterase
MNWMHVARMLLSIVVTVCWLGFGHQACAQTETPQTVDKSDIGKKLPLPGKTFRVEGCEAFVIEPSNRQNQSANRLPMPWVWYAPTLPNLPGDEEAWMFERFLAAGIAIAGIDVGESYGSPDGNRLYTALYEHLTKNCNYASKPVMLGRSRGGLMTLSWAADHAEQVAGFAGIYPVCNLVSYPGIERACGAYHLTPEELQRDLPKYNPIDRLEKLAKAGVPLFAIHGDDDSVVPLDANTGELKKRYEAMNGKIELIVATKQGHNMWSGFFQCQELVDFVIASSRTE